MPSVEWPDQMCGCDELMSKHRDWGRRRHSLVVVLASPGPDGGWCAFTKSGESYSDRMEPKLPARDGDKQQARHTVNLEVRCGRMARPTNEVCNEQN